MSALVLVGCGSGSGGGALATVNGETIPMDEYNRYLERKPLVIVQTQSGPAELPVAAPLGFQAMRDLINRRVLLQIAKDENLYPSADQVTKELEFQRKRDPQFIQRLQQQGMNVEEIKRDLTLDLAKENIITKGITVTPADADKFIKENPDRFMQPEQARLRIIVVRDEADKAKVDKDIASGQPFEQVAIHYSVAPNVRQTQGVYPQSVVKQMDPALQDLVRKTGENQVAPWQKFGTEWARIKVEQKVKAKPVTIDDTIKEQVRRGLAQEKGSQATDLAQRLLAKLKTANIVVSPPHLKTLWETVSKNLKEDNAEPKTGTGAAGATAGGPGTTR